MTRQPAVWALAETGASATEIGNASEADIDLPGARVWLTGTTKLVPRFAPLTEWGAVQLARRRCQLGPASKGLLTSEGSPTEHARRTSAAQAVHQILRRAGLGSSIGVGLRSVTALGMST
jgi:integrase